tara:strand:+ start:206 stop:841 length:636 start_codon:yes stop_codon:yes gene_type:complete
MIGIIDTGSKNIGSILNCLKYLKIKNKLIQNIKEIDKNITHIVLPGVGNFQNVIQTLNSKGFEKKKIKKIIDKKKTLAICVGMQILFDTSDESKISGLGYLKGKVRSLKKLKCKDTIPHIGFNSIKVNKNINLKFLKEKDFYFVHSYSLEKINLKKKDKDFVIGTTFHGNIDFISLIISKNLIATQFHPEKSGISGIELFKYFYGKKKSYI